MYYRAKCTKIVSTIESIFNTNKYHLVKDAKDYYIELPDEDLAEKVEQMNKLQEQFVKLELELIDGMPY